MMIPKTIDYDLILDELSGLEIPENAHTVFLPHEILREFNTVWIGSRRQTGKTTWLVNKVENYRNAIVVAYESVALDIQSRLEDRGIAHPVVTPVMIRDQPGKQTNSRLVLVDEAFLVLNKGISRDKFYRWLEPQVTDDVVIVMLTS